MPLQHRPSTHLCGRLPKCRHAPAPRNRHPAAIPTRPPRHLDQQSRSHPRLGDPAAVAPLPAARPPLPEKWAGGHAAVDLSPSATGTRPHASPSLPDRPRGADFRFGGSLIRSGSPHPRVGAGLVTESSGSQQLHPMLLALCSQPTCLRSRRNCPNPVSGVHRRANWDAGGLTTKRPTRRAVPAGELGSPGGPIPLDCT